TPARSTPACAIAPLPLACALRSLITAPATTETYTLSLHDALPIFAPNQQVVRELALRAQTALTFFLLVWCALGTLQSRPRPEPWAFLLGVLSSVNKTQSTKNHAQSLQRKSQQFPICYQMSWHSSLSAAF